MMPSPQIVCLSFPSPTPRLLALAEACRRFTPMLALRGQHALFLEIGGSLKLFQSEDLLVYRILTICRRFQLSPRVGIAPHAGQALIAAQWGTPTASKSLTAYQPQKFDQLPLSAIVNLLYPFTVLESSHPVLVMITQLQKLGVKRIEDLKLLPAKTLAARFGRIGLQANECLYHPPFTPWPQIVWQEIISEQIEIDPITHPANFDLCHLLFYIKSLTDRLSARLHGRALKAQVFDLKLQTESLSTCYSFTFHLPIPQSSRQHFLQIIKERLQIELIKKPFSKSIINARLQVLEFTSQRSNQQHFFTKNEQEEEALSSLLTRLHQRLGNDKVFVASPSNHYRPEGAWHKSSPASFLTAKNVTETKHAAWPAQIFERPTRLLPQPKLLFYKDQWLYDGSHQWKILRWLGPEHLSSDWWDQPFNRNYYKLLTTNREKLWVFSFPEHHHQLYLHGFFD